VTVNPLITYFVGYTVLGLVISLVVSAVHEPDISRVYRKALWAFVKLAIGSAVAIVLVEILYEYTIFTYPVLVVLLAWLIFGDRLWRQWKTGREERRAASRSRDS
jgi:hypothetical protein